MSNLVWPTIPSNGLTSHSTLPHLHIWFGWIRVRKTYPFSPKRKRAAYFMKYHMTYVSHMVWYKVTLPYYHPNLYLLHELDNQPLSVMNLNS